MVQGILVFIEERDGKIKKTSLEALSAARRFADKLQESVVALRLGAGEPSVDLAHYGADKILHAQHELLGSYSTEGYCATVVQAAKNVQPRIILGAAGSLGKDLLPRVAARLEVGLAQDCIEANIIDGPQTRVCPSDLCRQSLRPSPACHDSCYGYTSPKCFRIGRS